MILSQTDVWLSKVTAANVKKEIKKTRKRGACLLLGMRGMIKKQNVRNVPGIYIITYTVLSKKEIIRIYLQL